LTCSRGTPRTRTENALLSAYIYVDIRDRDIGSLVSVGFIALAVERVRPKTMTVVAIMAGLLPIMWGTGTGSEVMRRSATPFADRAARRMLAAAVLLLAGHYATRLTLP
jgi:Cu/Ag efflux pump CusA